MTEITLNVKPLSINKCWQGKRFKTKIYKNYEEELLLFLKRYKPSDAKTKFYKVNLLFGIENFALTDVDNLVKPLMDIIVKAGIIKDDRYVAEYNIRKIKSEKNFVKINIEGV